MRALSPQLKALTSIVFSARRIWYRLRYPNLVMGKDVLFIGRLRLKAKTQLILGDRVRIRQNVIINGGGRVTVGHDTLLNGCWIGSQRSVSVGSWCLISDCSVVDTDYHNLLPRDRHSPLSERAVSPVIIGDNVWIGAQAIVLKGSRLGSDSVVGSGAVVRGEVTEGVVVVGNPATVVRVFSAVERGGSAVEESGTL